MRTIAFALALSLALLAAVALADVPGLISYQGTLTDGDGVALDTTVSMTFSMHTDSTGGSQLWSETQPTVSVTHGAFNVLLGRVNPIADAVFSSTSCWLQIQVGSDPVMQPRQRIAAVGYAFRAAEADTADAIRGGASASDGDWTIAGSDMYSAVPGNVGIGVTVPYSRLDVRGTGVDDGALFQLSNSDRSHFINLYAGRSGDPNPYIQWKDGDPLRFSTDDGGWLEKMRITSDGKVGIGTIDPQKSLHISSTSSSYGMLQVEHGDATPGEASIGFKDRINPTSGQIWVAGVGGWGTDSSFVIGRGAANILIDHDSNVGIGTTAPESRLHVKGSDWPTYVTIEAPGGYAPGINLDIAGANEWSMFYHPVDSLIGFFRNGAGYRMVIKDNGNVGIGTSYPGSARLAVMGGSVGIGTDSPSQHLDVDYGNIIVQGTGSCDAPGEEGIVYLGTVHHLIKGVYGFGVKIGTYAAGDSALTIRELSGNVGIGTTTPDEKLHVAGTMKCDVLKLTGGADIAEPFEVSGTTEMEPGMVLTIDPENCGSLKIAQQAYDRCAAGIVSGAGDIEPGLIMSPSDDIIPGEHPVALTGRVYCWADASYGAIQTGDLLTTSDTPGHAMRVTDYISAQGAVIGKAMSSLEDGRGLVLVLVTLQ